MQRLYLTPRMLLATVVILCFFPALSVAQAQGNNAVYNSSGTCSPTCAASSAFIDASKFLGNGQGRDLCDTIYGIFNNLFGNTYPSAGAVVDARGISGVANLTCTHGSPWTEGNNYVSKPSTILLPATGAGSNYTPIVISTGWVLPANTHLIGQGDNIVTANMSTYSNTVIKAASNVGNMISFYSSSPPPNYPGFTYSGIAVENLVLDGNGLAVNGIVNDWAGNLSYVDHVLLYQILGTGLLVSGIASGSGPYTNIAFNTGSYSGSSAVCAQIFALASLGFTGTYGIHGLSCTASTAGRNVAVLLDASNNTLEDVRIDGFYTGVMVGSNAPAHSNVLTNIFGDTAASGLPVYVVQISNNNPVTDLSIMGVHNSMNGSGQYTIDDAVTSTLLADSSVALYALGESKSGGYSRFTTSPNAPTWAAGTVYPSGNCALGSLYSCTSKTSSDCQGYALWGCPAPSVTWTGIK